MALTCAQMIDEIRAIVGRTGSTAVGVMDDTRCTRWLNEGQEKIVDKCVGLHALSFKNTTSLDTTQSLSYAISDITVGDSSTGERVARIWDVYYLNGNNSVYLSWMATDEFDELYPDPTHSDIAPNIPTHWTRRGNNIEIFPLSACAYCDKDLRFDGDYYAADFTTNDTTGSDISKADDGLIMYGIARAWEAIGDQNVSFIWDQKFNKWLDEYKANNDNLHEWDGKLFGDELI